MVISHINDICIVCTYLISYLAAGEDKIRQSTYSSSNILFRGILESSHSLHQTILKLASVDVCIDIESIFELQVLKYENFSSTRIMSKKRHSKLHGSKVFAVFHRV